jgi:hypothetical protein
MQDLDRHPAPQPHVVGQEHVRGRADPYWGEQAVAVAEDAPDVLVDPGRRHPHEATVPHPPNR